VKKEIEALEEEVKATEEDFVSISNTLYGLRGGGGGGGGSKVRQTTLGDDKEKSRFRSRYSFESISTK
jgi:hypothetical protein